jgi:hypothetical protein
MAASAIGCDTAAANAARMKHRRALSHGRQHNARGCTHDNSGPNVYASNGTVIRFWCEYAATCARRERRTADRAAARNHAKL